MLEYLGPDNLELTAWLLEVAALVRGASSGDLRLDVSDPQHTLNYLSSVQRVIEK